MAYLNMTDQSQQCPDTLRTSSGMRTCGLTKNGCTSTSYSANFSFSQICGRISAQARGGTDGFTNENNINENYLDGISLTHGSPSRQHIWSLATTRLGCPCTNRPNFVGATDYFCDLTEIVWNGRSECSTNNPPWFHRQLSASTTDDIEMRVCVSNFPYENIHIQTVEIYIQ